MTGSEPSRGHASDVHISGDKLIVTLGDGSSVAVTLTSAITAGDPIEPQPPRENDSNLERAFQALMAEYGFTNNLIPLYRGYQMKVLGLGLSVYVATVGLLGAYAESPRLDGLQVALGTFITWPVLFLTLAFLVMEVRIKRASRYIDRTLSETLDSILDLEDRLGKPAVLKWERSPGRHLTRLERWLSGSGAFVILLALPAFCGSGIFLYSRREVDWGISEPIAFVGAFLLGVTAALTSIYSIRSESRDGKDAYNG